MEFQQQRTSILQMTQNISKENGAVDQQNFVMANEQTFYSQWQKTEIDKRNLEAKIVQLQMQLKVLQDKYTGLKRKLKRPQEVEYQTDEEELSKETEWIRAKTGKNKKRKMNTLLLPPQKA